jgi:hypothetical protein
MFDKIDFLLPFLYHPRKFMKAKKGNPVAPLFLLPPGKGNSATPTLQWVQNDMVVYCLLQQLFPKLQLSASHNNKSNKIHTSFWIHKAKT